MYLIFWSNPDQYFFSKCDINALRNHFFNVRWLLFFFLSAWYYKVQCNRALPLYASRYCHVSLKCYSSVWRMTDPISFNKKKKTEGGGEHIPKILTRKELRKFNIYRLWESHCTLVDRGGCDNHCPIDFFYIWCDVVRYDIRYQIRYIT